MNEVTKIRPHEPQLPADPMVSMIERLVLNPDADLDKLERMLALKERMEAQNARVSFARALSDARAEIPPIMKDATVDYTSKDGKRTNYQHETLAGIAKVIDPILSRFGLSYRFRTEQGQRGVQVTCIIAHAEGHFEETSLSGSPDGSGSKNSFQAVGSAVTYLQRYTLKAALGLSAEVDDDAQGAAPRRSSERQQQRPQQQARQEDVSPAQRVADQMITGIRKHGARSVEADPKFAPALEQLRRTNPELAAHVEAELDTWHKANPPAASSIIDDSEIPY